MGIFYSFFTKDPLFDFFILLFYVLSFYTPAVFYKQK